MIRPFRKPRLPALMVTAYLVTRIGKDARLPDSAPLRYEWYAAEKISRRKYRIVHYSQPMPGGALTGTPKTDALGYNEALMMLEACEMGDPKTAGDGESLDGRMRANRRACALDSTLAFRNATHYSLFSPRSQPRAGRRLAALFGRVCDWVLDTDERPVLHKRTKILTRGRNMQKRRLYYRAEIIRDMPGWMIYRMEDKGDFTRPCIRHYVAMAATQEDLFKALDGYEDYLIRQYHGDRARCELEDRVPPEQHYRPQTPSLALKIMQAKAPPAASPHKAPGRRAKGLSPQAPI